MSQRQPSQENYGSVRGHARTDRFRGEQPHGDDILRGQRTERQLHEDSPTRHDVEFYVRKVNRYQAELARLEHDLSVTKFRLSRAEDAQIKYDILFKEHQKTQQELTKTYYEKNNIQKNLDFAGTQQQRLQQQVRSLKNELSIQRKNNEQLRNREQAKRVESTSQNHGEKQALRQAHNREIQTVKNQGRERSNALQRQLNELNIALQLKEATESSLNAKLDHIKKGKNQQIARLQQLTSALRSQLGSTHVLNEETALKKRSDVISQTQHRLSSVRNLTQLIQDTLAEQISNLNATLTKKNQEIRFILECDAKQLRNHADSQNSLKLLISRLEDKIFTIQRENQLQLFQTIARLQAQYQQNLQQSQAQWQNSRIAHNSVVDSLRKENQSLKRQVQLMGSENLALQRKCKLLSEQQQHSVQMLSQKILGMEAERDKALQNYTTSMKQIEDDAKTKLDDLHSAVTNKNGQNQILVAQLNLKNGQITHLLQELSRLRDLNRQKIKKLENTNASEQNALNKQITDYKNYIFQLKRNLHEVENTLSDFEAESKLQKQMIRQELQAQKQANQLLKSRNKFLAQWAYELERDLKAERVSNVNILHDQNISQRQNVQVRQEVRVQLEVLKQKEIEQQKNIHKLEKNRLQSQLAHREHELRDKKEQLSRLLVQYKALESKVGKSSKVDRSAEDSAKCRATIQAEILLTQNIFNAINRP